MVFSSILNMLFSYQFFTFSHPFSQLQNKFRNRKFQYINLNKNQNKTFVKLKNSVKWREGGRASDRQLRWGMGGISVVLQEAQSWRCFKRCNLGGASGSAILPVLGCDETDVIWGWGQWFHLGLGAMVLQVAQSLLAFSFSLLFSKSRNHLKVKLKLEWFYG